jgi:hypothetical protein
MSNLDLSKGGPGRPSSAPRAKGRKQSGDVVTFFSETKRPATTGRQPGIAVIPETEEKEASS